MEDREPEFWRTLIEVALSEGVPGQWAQHRQHKRRTHNAAPNQEPDTGTSKEATWPE
jgi:hypothetical protein